MAFDPSSLFMGWSHFVGRTRAFLQVTTKGGDATPGGSSSDAQGVGWAEVVALTGGVADEAGPLGSAANPLNVTGGGAPSPATKVSTAALASGLVVKAAAGVLQSFEVSADATLAAAAWWVMIFDAVAVPADGAVTPAKVYAVPSGQNQMGGAFNAGGVAFTTGIAIAVSTTGPFNKTASAHAFISGDRL